MFSIRRVPKAKSPQPLLTIGRLARECGTTVDTLRYYEREGLLAAPRRAPSGYRLYAADALARLRFIREAKRLGFSLDEIKELLALQRNPRSTCGDVRERARAKLVDIERRMASLDRMKGALARLERACPGDGPVTGCPILEALEEGSER